MTDHSSNRAKVRQRLIDENEFPKLPESWGVERFRFLFRESKERNGKWPVGQMLSVSEYRGVVPREYEHDDQKRTDEELENYRVVRSGQLAVNSMWLNHLGLGVSSFEGHVSPAYAVYDISDRLDRRFAHHLLRSNLYLKIYLRYLYGIRPNSFQIKSDDWDSIPIIVPDLPTQREIAAFLDRETARIDRLIEKKGCLLKLLKEKGETQAHRLVFGLDQSGEKRNVPSSWVADFPKHWLYLRCAHIFENLDYRRIPVSSEERAGLAKIYPYYGASGVIDEVDGYLFDEETILVGEDGANLIMRSTPIAFIARGKYWVNNHAHILRPVNGDMEYWVHALNQVPFEIYVTGSAQPKLTSASLGNIRLPVPPKNEQVEIASQIDRTNRRINAAKAPVVNSIRALKEYRSALITAVVTGQIDAATWRKAERVERQLDAMEAKAES